MLESSVQGVLALVRAALTGEAQPLPADFDLEDAYEPIIKHNIAVMALEGAVLCGLDKQLPTMQKLFVRAFRDMGIVEQQDRAAKALFAALEAEGVDFMPVKGALLRDLYPKRGYRSMGDMDVLIREEQHARIRKILQELGYEDKGVDEHCFMWRHKAFLLELHKTLIPVYNKDYYAYFGSGWKCAQATQTSRHRMSAENEYIYVFTHLAKHYRGGGVGIRQMCDLWLLRGARTDMDDALVRRELGKLELLEFHDAILQTLNAWFGSGQHDARTAFISKVIYESGAFGQPSMKTISDGARLAGERKADDSLGRRNLLQHIFPTRSGMELRFPVLKKAPVLLPFLWLYRGVRIMTVERYKVEKVRRVSQVYTREDVGAYQEALEYVGLRFRNK